MKKNGENFECYSKPLFGYLTMNKFRYLHSFKHNETKRQCWVYEMNDDLSKALTEWKDSGKGVKAF